LNQVGSGPRPKRNTGVHLATVWGKGLQPFSSGGLPWDRDPWEKYFPMGGAWGSARGSGTSRPLGLIVP